MLRSIVLILATATLLVGLWFKDGYILGVAEDGIIFYDISRYLALAQYSWMEYPGLGSPSLTQVAAKPTYLFLNFLQTSGIPGFVIQAFVFWFLLSSAGVGMTLLVKELFPKLEYKYVLLGVLLYWFNPISLTSVFNRSLLNYFFFFALLPIATFIYIRGLKNSAYFWAILFNLVLLPYSYALSYVGFNILLWFWLILITVSWSVIFKNLKFCAKFFLLTLILFIIFNAYWILPTLNLYLIGGVTPFESLFIGQNNPGVLQALSKKLGKLTDIFSLANASFLETDLNWVKDFYAPVSRIIGFIIIGIILYSLVKLRKEKVIVFLGMLLFSIIFFAKGSNPPFGQIYSFLFERILILQVLRNSFEKFGFLLSLTVSVMFAYNLYYLRKRFVFHVFLLLIVTLSLPFFTTHVFTNTFPPADNLRVGYRVKVPEYYKKANLWLLSQPGNFRYIGLPLKAEGITYKWEKGYVGVELSHVLFVIPGIMHNTSVPYFNQIVPQIEKVLLSDEDFYKLANILNVKYFFVREDIDFKIRDMTDPQIVKQNLISREQEQKVKRVGEFGKLTFWENLQWRDLTFYPANSFKISPHQSVSDLSSIDVVNGEVLIGEAFDYIEQNNNSFGLPKISYQKINLTRYAVSVKDASVPFMLVFSELFNKGWQVSYNEQNQTPEHFRVNHYANGWWIEKQGDYDLTVEFIPQRWLEVGQKVSLFSYAGILFMPLIYLIKRKRA